MAMLCLALTNGQAVFLSDCTVSPSIRQWVSVPGSQMLAISVLSASLPFGIEPLQGASWYLALVLTSPKDKLHIFVYTDFYLCVFFDEASVHSWLFLESLGLFFEVLRDCYTFLILCFANAPASLWICSPCFNVVSCKAVTILLKFNFFVLFYYYFLKF